MRLVITEKPSVARDLARVLGATRKHEGWLEGDGLRITWCVGHLLEFEEPHAYDPAWKAWALDTLPMIPERFTLRVRKGAEDQWRVVAAQLRDRKVTEVVNACDAGREGELIFRHVYEHAGCDRPVLRFWVSSLTDEAIRAGWRALQPAARFDPLAAAARCRAEADWIVGLNATRAMTCRTREEGGDALWSVGRVQTPTLAMIVARDRAIEAFVPETYWRVEARIEAAPGAWKAAWFRRDPEQARPPLRGEGADRDEAPHEERLPSAEAAEAVAGAARGRPGRVVSAERKTRTEPPPLLYDLTELQRRANQRYGLSAQRTLEIAQALYEKHKLITYPRTDARHLTSDQVGELPGVLRAVGALPVYRPFVEALLERPLRVGPRLVDDAEVGDHHAIVPTTREPVAGRLDADEKRVYDLVVRRLLAALSPDARIDTAEIVVAVEPDPAVELPEGVTAPLHFRARGRVVREAGWQAVDPPRKQKDHELPPVDTGEPVQAAEVETAEGRTRPPRPHDDASLLRAMETAGKDLDDAELRRAMRQSGLGTPATRAAILQTLLDRGYVVREDRALRSTPKGRALIEALPVPELASAELTGRWEHRLSAMAEGRDDRAAFMRDVADYTARIVARFREAALPQAALVRTERAEEPPIGTCPACGAPVRRRGQVWACDTGRSCPFVVFGTMSKRKISARMVKELLAKGRTEPVKGFRSKAGREFEAGLVWADGKVGFWFPDRQEGDGAGQGRAPERADAPAEARGGRKRGRGNAPQAPREEGPPRELPRDDTPRRPWESGGRRPETAGAWSGGRDGVVAPEDLHCPACGQGRVIRGHAAWGCSRWREGCGWRLPFELDGVRLRDRDAVQRIRGARPPD